MSNHFWLRGVISHITLRETSLFMTIREEVRPGARNRPQQHTVKGYCPDEMKSAPGMWAQKYQHLTHGMTVIVEGKLSFEQEKVPDPAGSGQHVPVRHPFQERDLYSPYIWATQIDAVFDPSVHMTRAHGAAAPAQVPQQRSAPVPTPTPRRAPAMNVPPEELPPMPMAEGIRW